MGVPELAVRIGLPTVVEVTVVVDDELTVVGRTRLEVMVVVLDVDVKVAETALL